ncbi:MAG: arsenite methyltransferase [Chloroflexi bacterium]|nr:arsenite methyltransferase [Chloroflexota bacterium]
MSVTNSNIKQKVSERYGQLAELMLSERPSAASCCGPSCCGDATSEADISRALNLYTPEEVRDLPPEIAQETLGCGNPMAIASLRPGETVLDLGSGAGLDCFLAARQVGPTGGVIGLDMTDSMLELARRNQAKVGLDNIEFRKGEIEQMPVASASVDVIISNCVINLSTDKDAVFREAFRVLKPGGRFAVSDVVTRGEVPEVFRKALDLWAGCLSGALDEQDYLQRLRAAGFTDVKITGSAPIGGAEIDEWATQEAASSGCCGADLTGELANKVVSAKIQAVKPQA